MTDLSNIQPGDKVLYRSGGVSSEETVQQVTSNGLIVLLESGRTFNKDGSPVGKSNATIAPLSQDKEKIRSALNEMMSGAGGMISVQTVGYIMQRLLQEEPEMARGSATIYLSTIAMRAKDLSEEIEKWTYKGRFSEALFDYHYLRQPGQDEPGGIYKDLKGVLMKLDATYRDQFRIASAINYLLDVRKDALLLRDELNKDG